MESWFIVPHEVTTSSIRVWVCWPLKRGLREDVVLLLKHSKNNTTRVIPLESAWETVGESSVIKFHYQWITIEDLNSGSHYLLKITDRGLNVTLGEGQFETLPASLPAKSEHYDLRNRPFTVLLGSCYSHKDDNGRVANAYKKLYDYPSTRPHIKFLVGDQVYLDQPPTDFISRQSTKWLLSHFSQNYYGSWNSLRSLLQNGATVFTSDDHEYWNNYPTTPPAAWLALSASKSYRRDYSYHAKALYNGIQGGRATHQFSIGEDLSLFIADTRINRMSTPHRFMDAQDMSLLRAWVKSLKSPGVLVLGQPLLYRGIDKKGPFIADYNIGAFDQYWELVDALSLSEHDIVLLSGDVHFGRIATTKIRRVGKKDRKLVEVIASPMSLISSGNYSSKAVATIENPQIPALYPALPIPGLLEQTPTKVERTVRSYKDDKERTQEHFMTLSFSEGSAPTKVKMTVNAWLVRLTDQSGFPTKDWEWSIELGDKLQHDMRQHPKWIGPVLSTMMTPRQTAQSTEPIPPTMMPPQPQWLESVLFTMTV